MAKPDKQSGRRYSEAEVRAILDRALRDAQRRDVTHDELVAAAEGIGISRDAIESASREIEAGRGEEEARAAILARRRKGLRSHLFTFVLVNVFLFAVNALTQGTWWFYWPLLAWGLGLAFHVRAALSSDVSPRRLRREMERSAALAQREQRRRLKEQRRLERLERNQRLERSAEDLGQAVEEGVATVLSRIAREIRGSAPPAPPAPPAGDAARRQRIAPLDADEAESEALGEEEAERGARRGRGGR